MKFSQEFLLGLRNSWWLIADKLFRMGGGIFVSVLTARYLGPEKFGLLNYSLAVISIFASVASMGLNSIVVRDLVRRSDEMSVVLGSTFALQIMGAFVAFVLSLFLMYKLRPEDEYALIIVFSLSLVFFVKSTDVLRYWFESKLLSKYVVIADGVSFMLLSLVRIGFVYFGFSLLYFSFAYTLEAVFAAALVAYFFIKSNEEKVIWRIDTRKILDLFDAGWPLILSGLASMLYMRIDQLIIGKLMGDAAVGVYSAAVKLSEAWYFVPISIVVSFFPGLVKVREENIAKYHGQLMIIFEVMVLISLLLAVPVSFLSDEIILFLYGVSYVGAGSVLIIHIWAAVFVFLGVASSRWFVAENLQKYTFYRTLAGVLISVASNYILIPLYGISGAAYSAVLSQATASVLFNALNAKTRSLFYMQIRALLMPNLRSKVIGLVCR